MREWLTCPICRSSEKRLLFSYEQSRFIPGVVVSCGICQCIYKIPHRGSVQEYYDDQYAANLGHSNEAERREFDSILTFIAKNHSKEGGLLLDIGCGPGRFLEAAENAGFLGHGVELTRILATVAMQRFGERIICADIMKAELARSRFDVVVMLDVIEHVQDPVALLQRAAEVVKPEGKIVIYTPNHGSLIVKLALLIRSLTMGGVTWPADEIFDSWHVTFFTVKSLAQAIEAAGLVVTNSKMIGFDAARRQTARGATALILRLIEVVSRLFPDGPFRVAVVARIPMPATG